MTSISFERRVDAAPATAWRVLTDPDRYAAAVPALHAVDYLDDSGVGLRRRCTGTDGATWVERAVVYDPGRRLSMAIDVADSPTHRRLFEQLVGDWQVTPTGEATRLDLTFDYDLKYGPLGRLFTPLANREFRSLATTTLDDLAVEMEREQRVVA
jgi:carbon monoxide dehydrogenase subunit G